MPSIWRGSVVRIFSSVLVVMWTGLTVVLLVGWLLSFRLYDAPV